MKFIFVDRVAGKATEEACINCDHIVFMTAIGDKTNIILSTESEILCANSIEEILSFIDEAEGI